MIGAIQKVVRAADVAFAHAYLALFRERNSLMSFLFHSLFRDDREISRNLVDPLERTTVGNFRELIQYYVRHGYRFVGPNDLLTGLDPSGKYAMLTFDDGYYNNILTLPVLEEFKVPAVFFISTDNVRQNKCYWWDVLFRERVGQGASRSKIYHEAIAMKSMTTEQIEAHLSDRFGPNAFTPRSDIDRPFSPKELREFAKHPYVHIGNHTANHAILTNYTPEQVQAQIGDAQKWLHEEIGVNPCAIAYPNGAHSQRILEISRSMGLKIGFTVRPEKNVLPLATDASLMRLGRFCPYGNGHMNRQCHTYRSDFLFYSKFRDGYLRLARGHVAQ